MYFYIYFISYRISLHFCQVFIVASNRLESKVLWTGCYLMESEKWYEK